MTHLVAASAAAISTWSLMLAVSRQLADPKAPIILRVDYADQCEYPMLMDMRYALQV